MGFRNFATCHCHPQSLDSGSTPEAFVKRELELGTGVVTCTDHGTLQACRKIYDLGKAAGLTPILGLEGYLRDDDCEILAKNGYTKNANGAFVNAPKYMHFCVHFLDQTAYECCVRLLSKADERLEATLEKLEAKDRKHGQERKPLFTWRDLEELGAQNTTFTTGCMIGVVQRHLFDNNDAKTAGEYFDKLKAIVKPGNLYTELNPHDTSKDWIQGIFLTMADGTKLRFYSEKKLMTNAGEVTAAQLAKTWGKSDHKTLKGIKDRSTWREVPEQEIVNAEDLEGFFQNECKPWAPNGDYQAGLNRAMRFMAKQRGIPVIVGDDSHYAHREEKVVQDVRLAQSGPWRFYSSYHRQSSDEAFEHFNRTLGMKEGEFEAMVENSHAWAGRFKDFKFDTPPSLPTKFYEAEYEKRPWFKTGDHDNSLRYTLELIRKHGRMDWNNKAMRERLQAEIKLLHNNGTIDLLPYFMVDEEVCSLYESKGLLTGPGRGSAAGLILTYLLGITHVDPLQYGLSLERFITQDRIASGGLPDIDQDLPHRELLVDPETGWLKQRFGDHYAQISVDSTLKLKMAVRDVSRAMRHHVPGDIEGLAKKFVMPPQGVSDHDFVMGYHTDGEGDIPGSKDYDPALKEYIKRYPDDWKIVQKCLGLARQKGRHACLPAGEAIFLSCGRKKSIEQCDGEVVLTGWGWGKAKLLDQGVREVVEYVLEDGRKIRCTPDHRVWTSEGWVEIQQAMERGLDLELRSVGVAIGSGARLNSTRSQEADVSSSGQGERPTSPPGSAQLDTGGSGHGQSSRRLDTGADAASMTVTSSMRLQKTSERSGCSMSTSSMTAKPDESSTSTSTTSSAASSPCASTARDTQPGSIESTINVVTCETTSSLAVSAATVSEATT